MKKETVEVNVEFIKEVHKCSCPEWQERIENELPDLFKPKLEVGKWFRNTENKALLYVTSLDNNITAYGFNAYGVWVDLDNGWFYNLDREKNIQPTTNGEVEQALIKEANIRGYTEGVLLLNHGSRLSSDYFIFLENTNKLYAITQHNQATPIFDNGKWTNIFQEPEKTTMTVAEIEEKLGYSINIVK